MKLRNKKTGLVGELYYEPDKEYHFTVATEDPADMEIYRSLTKLNENWDDYKPAEPLIKDEKIRKAVRAWWNIQENPFKCASVLCKSYTGVSGNKDHDGYYNYCIYGYVQSHNINKTATDFEFRTKTYFKYDRDKDYTIDDLCGGDDDEAQE